MRNWILVTALVVVVGGGGLMYYIFSGSPVDAPGMPLQIVVQPEQKSGNPLLTATTDQFDRWFPNHCQAELYYQPTKEQHTRNVCVLAVVREVESSTGVRLVSEDVFNPEVLSHWRKVHGLK